MDGKPHSQIPSPLVGSPGRSAFSSPAVAPRPPSKRRPSGDGSERHRLGRQAILQALMESGVCVCDGDCDATHTQQQHVCEQAYNKLPTSGHPHKGLVRQLESCLAQQRPEPSRVLRLAERLLAATVTAFAGAAGDHNAGGGAIAMDILGFPELRERVMRHLSPRDLCRCRRVSRQLMVFGDEALARIHTFASADWAGITASQLERRLPLCAPNLTTISWDASPPMAQPFVPAGSASVPTAVLTDDMLRVAARTAGPSLRKLTLRGCGRLTECGLLAVAEHCGARLTALELRGCVGLTDASLNLLSERCSSLRQVDLSDSALITDAAVGQLIARCPLTSLTLARCASITDDTVAYLVATHSAAGCRGGHAGDYHACAMQRLDLRGCLGITGESCELLVSVQASGQGSAWSALSLASTLHSVDLRGTNATDEEQRWLMQTLQRHQSF